MYVGTRVGVRAVCLTPQPLLAQAARVPWKNEPAQLTSRVSCELSKGQACMPHPTCCDVLSDTHTSNQKAQGCEPRANMPRYRLDP